jgi:hypothetical protein
MSPETESVGRLRQVENLHVILWLIKDLSWVSGWHVPAVIMIAPTLAVAVWITWKSRRLVSEWYHNLAVTAWILANSTWMVGEFFLQDRTKPAAQVFFVIGMSILAFYYGRLAIRRFF